MRSIAKMIYMPIAAGMIFVTSMAAFANSVETPNAIPKEAPKIAIVIDDLGYQKESGRSLASLPYPITMAVIPGSPFAHDVISFAVIHGKEVILHVPMETLNQSKWEEGLNTQMDYIGLNSVFREMLDKHPQISGINNHGGSKFTADSEKMDWVMEVLNEKQLFFLDSRTTKESAAITAAMGAGVNNVSRDVFLDNEQSPESIAQAFDHLRNIARKHGQAIAIGHPYPETLSQLQAQLPALVKEGFELTFCSELLTISSQSAPASNSITH